MDIHALFLDPGFTKLSILLEDILPYFASSRDIGIQRFFKNSEFDSSCFLDFIEKNKINLLVTGNPYVSPESLEIYNFCRLNKLPLLCFERGALPDSWYLSSGFNVDSAEFLERSWNKELTAAQIREVDSYMDDILTSNNYLERQPALDLQYLQTMLSGKKIMFAPLQLPRDTVIKYFAGNAGNFSSYLAQLSQLSTFLKEIGWQLIVKRHPLDADTVLPDNLVEVDANFIDIMRMADAVTLINSGTGIYAAMSLKPCYIWGQAFYQHPQINMAVASNEEIITDIKNGCHKPDKIYIQKFIYYLWKNFYSFGKATTLLGIANNGNRYRKTMSIKFNSLKFSLSDMIFSWDSESGATINGIKINESKLLNKIALENRLMHEVNKISHDLLILNKKNKPDFIKKLFSFFSGQKKAVADPRYYEKYKTIYINQGLTSLVRALNSKNMSGIAKAEIYTRIARQLHPTRKDEITALARLAWLADPCQARQRWYAARLNSYGESRMAGALLSILPNDSELNDTEKNLVAAIKKFDLFDQLQPLKNTVPN